MAHQGYYTNPSNLENINDALVQVDADADRAEAAANAALVSETNAAASVVAAQNTSNAALAYANDAQASATSAANSSSNAATSASNASTSATNAATSATASANSATASANSATASANSASEAAASAASIVPSNFLLKASNLSDVQSVSSARTNLGVYSTAQVDAADALKANKAGDTFTGNVNVPSINGGQLAGMRNKIINGKMEIEQRGTSFPAIGLNAFAVDRWRRGGAGSTAVMTWSQSSDVPPGNELQNSLRVAVTTADAAVGAGEAENVVHPIEGYNVRDLIGRTFTLSFWVRSSKTGVHCVSFVNQGGDRSYILEYTVSAANTWEYKTVTVVGGLITAGTWDWTNLQGLAVRFALLAGASSHGSAGAWQAGNFSATANQVNCLDTVGNIFAITGVQLEVGSVATPFEHRSFGAELALCQRYYERAPIFMYNNNGTSRAVNGANVGFAYWKVAKRASPTTTKQDSVLNNVFSAVVDVSTGAGARVVVVQDFAGGMEYVAELFANAEL